MANVAQLVRAPDCGSGGRRFEPAHSPQSFQGFQGFHLEAFFLGVTLGLPFEKIFSKF